MIWLISSAIAFVLLSAQAILATFALMIFLNGYPSIPDAMVIIYLGCTGGIVPALSLLVGWGIKKAAEKTTIRAWLAGIGLAALLILILPAILAGLAFALLAGFGMLQF
jgi:hypothetical protein